MHGWARDPAFPHASVSLIVTADDEIVDRVVANVYRQDLVDAGFAHGKFGFNMTFNPPLSPLRTWLLHVRSERDGEDMPGSPVRLGAASTFDDDQRDAIAAVLDTFDTEADLDQRIAFLAAQRDRLLQSRADLRSRRFDRAAARGKGIRTGPVMTRRALVIDQRVPDPERDGGSNALVSHMKALKRLGYAVTFAPQSMAGGEGVAALERAGFACCYAPWYTSVEDVLRREANGFDLVYMHRVAIASAYTALVRQSQSRARVVYSVADLHHLRLERQAQAEDRPELLVEAERTRLEERWMAHAADCVITHSTAEAQMLRPVLPPDRVHVVAWSMPIRARPAAFAKRSGLAFIGSFDHAPNVAAARILRDELMPAVHAADPTIRCLLVGAGLPPSLLATHQGLEVVGPVADLPALLDSVRLTVAPLTFGAGLKGKVLASFAAGTPCVCSRVAVEGMTLPDGLRELVASDMQEALRAILRLHNDAAYHRAISAQCLAFAKATFSDAAIDEAMRQALGMAAPDAAAPPRREARPRRSPGG